MKLVEMGTMGENKFMSREFYIYMYVFKSFITNVVDGAIYLLYNFLKIVGIWYKYGLWRRPLIVSIDKI